MKKYIAANTGNELIRKEAMFNWRGKSFSGLVDEGRMALYDNPEDSFADHVGIPNALSEGLIEELPGEVLEEGK